MPCCKVCRSCYDGDPSHKKDSAWAWIVCAAASTNLAFSFGLILSFGVLLPVFMDYFEESRENTGKGINCLGINSPRISCEIFNFAFEQTVLAT